MSSEPSNEAEEPNAPARHDAVRAERPALAAARFTGLLVVMTGILANPFFLRDAWSGQREEWGTLQWTAYGVLWAAALAAGVALMVSMRAGRLAFTNKAAPLGGTLLGFALVSLIFAGVETTFYVLKEFSPPPAFTLAVSPQNLTPQLPLGYIGLPGIFREVTRSNRVTVAGYDVLYTQGENGFRVTPQPPRAVPSKHAIFFGGSFTFGEAVNDGETLPAQFARVDQRFRAYNYGHRGYGPSQCLALLMSGRVQSEVCEPDGFAVFTLIEDHVRRDQSSMVKRNHYTPDFPLFEFDARGIPTYLGPSDEVQPWRTWAYTWLGREQFLRWANVDYPIAISPADIAYTASILAAARKIYCDDIGGQEFYVLAYPDAGDSLIVGDLVNELRGRGIPVLDYRFFFRRFHAGAVSAVDGHPTAVAYEALARKLSVDLSPGKKFLVDF